MNSRTPAFVLSALIAAHLGGCVGVSVKKVDANGSPATPGVRYSLPKPLIQVTPNEDGTMAVEVIYVPDEDSTYAIDTSNFASIQELNLDFDDAGFLAKVTYNPEAEATAKAAVETATDIAKQSIEKSTADEAQRKKDREQKKKDDAAKKDALDKAYNDAEAELEQANFELSQAKKLLDQLNARPTKDQVAIDAQILKVDEAEHKVALKTKARDAAKAARDNAGLGNGKNASMDIASDSGKDSGDKKSDDKKDDAKSTAGDAKADGAKKETSASEKYQTPTPIPGTRHIAGPYAPVLFEILEEDDYARGQKTPTRVVRLKALSINKQKQLRVPTKDLSQFFKKKEESTPTSAGPKIQQSEDLIKLTEGVKSVTLQLTGAVSEVVKGQTKLQQLPQNVDAAPLQIPLQDVKLDESKKVVTVVFPETGLQPGKYLFTLSYKFAPANGGDAKPGEAEVNLVVKPK